jgi:hypothetical protein
MLSASTQQARLPSRRQLAGLDAQLVARSDLIAQAKEIDDLLVTGEVHVLASYGVGTALLEAALLRARPSRRLLLADYAPQTIERLHTILPDVDVLHHDLRSDGPLAADLHLFHRIDTELDDDEWRLAFRRFASVSILAIPAGVINLREAARELAIRIRTRNRSLTASGWLRTERALVTLREETHIAERISIGDRAAWMLEPRGLKLRNARRSSSKSQSRDPKQADLE